MAAHGAFSRGRHHAASMLCFAFILTIIDQAQAQREPFSKCHETFRGIINGSLTHGSLNKDTIWGSGHLYTGPVPSLDEDSYPRASFITPTYIGCKHICGGATQLNLPTTALGLVANWIFPLAILLNLPWESLHENRMRGTMTATLSWLGSPQTSLTATFDNFQQIRRCRKSAKRRNNLPKWNDLYYVLSIFNQFDAPSSGPNQKLFMETLIYGLYRVMQDDSSSEDIVLLRILLSELAFQLRMLRRRAVVPTIASLATFIVAFVISVVLGFSDVGDDATVSPLILGLLFGWLPILVIFTIVDRNAVSSVWTAQLMSRWLYNVHAIRANYHPELEASGQAQDIQWWTAWPSEDKDTFPCRVGDYVGQGRKMQFCGLVAAVLKKADSTAFDSTIKSYEKAAGEVVKQLNGSRPVGWFATSVLSLSVVWTQILMAVLISYNTPTEGIGCWSGGELVYGALTSISWIVSMFAKKPRPSVQFACHIANALALSWLVTFVILVLTGGTNNCTCMTNFGNYMNFEGAKFYLEFCNVQRYWIGATVVGGLVPFGAFLIAVFGWIECQQLWAANEIGPPEAEKDERGIAKRIDWSWLRYTRASGEVHAADPPLSPGTRDALVMESGIRLMQIRNDGLTPPVSVRE